VWLSPESQQEHVLLNLSFSLAAAECMQCSPATEPVECHQNLCNIFYDHSSSNFSFVPRSWHRPAQGAGAQLGMLGWDSVRRCQIECVVRVVSRRGQKGGGGTKRGVMQDYMRIVGRQERGQRHL
jgi:hypothetical protein